jgi:hypothetical protein
LSEGAGRGAAARRCHEPASPLSTEAMSSTACAMPPAKSPLRKRGTIERLDELGDRIGERAFETVADLDARLCARSAPPGSSTPLLRSLPPSFQMLEQLRWRSLDRPSMQRK